MQAHKILGIFLLRCPTACWTSPVKGCRETCFTLYLPALSPFAQTLLSVCLFRKRDIHLVFVPRIRKRQFFLWGGATMCLLLPLGLPCWLYSTVYPGAALSCDHARQWTLYLLRLSGSLPLPLVNYLSVFQVGAACFCFPHNHRVFYWKPLLFNLQNKMIFSKVLAVQIHHIIAIIYILSWLHS